jgi:hypothetical protein
MKKITGMVAIIVLSLLISSVKAQETKPATPTTPTQPTTWNAKKNPTVDSITAPFESKLIQPRPALTTADIYPVIGTYESSTNTDAPSVTISLDPDTKGLVWVEGLPQGKVKAMLRKSPATYKIPAQTTADGKEVQEGTLIYDKDANILSINIGHPYISEDPASVFTMTTTTNDMAVNDQPVTKTKTKNGKVVKTKVKEQPKPWVYTGTKVDKTTASTTNQ